MNLTPVQQQIVDTPGNLIVRASAGTGKTHTMVAKIATEIEHNHTHKSIAAITFTIKAAQEIKDRLTIDSSRHFIGTKIYIDEYQDCDKSMHMLFMYICDTLGIDTFVVGDEKQSIYIWRGAYPEAFKSIWNKPNFHKVFMGDNFRSCQQIQNYSKVVIVKCSDYYANRFESNLSQIFALSGLKTCNLVTYK